MSYKIAIIGAGIAGLVAGILLRERGAEVAIYEKHRAIQPLGGNLGIWPNGSKVLLNLPCAKAIHALYEKVEDEYVGDAEGNTLIKVKRDMFLAVNSHPVMNICRHDLQHILLKEFGEANIIFNQPCKTLENIKADLIIGADGLFSTVRQIIFPEAKLRYAGHIVLVGIFQYPKNQTPKHHFIWGKNRFLINLPNSAHDYMLYIGRPLTEGKLKKEFITKEQQLQLFRGWSAEADQILNHFEQSLKNQKCARHYFCGESFEMEVPETWHKNNVVLIGDAAHPMGSVMALGTNNALEDAQTLTQSLYTEKNIEDALKRFEAIQIPRTKAFFAVENKRKEFLLHANETTYQEHLYWLKNTPANKLYENFMQLLKGES